MPVENFREQPVGLSFNTNNLYCGYVVLLVCCWSEWDYNCSAFVIEKQ